MMADVTVRLSYEQAVAIQAGLSDLLCWSRGYTCGLPADDRPFYGPMGIGEAQNLNIALKGAISDVDQGLLSPQEAENARLRRWLHQMAQELRTGKGKATPSYLTAVECALAGAESPQGFGISEIINAQASR